MDSEKIKEYDLITDDIKFFIEGISERFNELILRIANHIIGSSPERQQIFAPLLYSEFCDDEIEHPIEWAVKIAEIVAKNIVLSDFTKHTPPPFDFKKTGSVDVFLSSPARAEISDVLCEAKLSLRDFPKEDVSRKRLMSYANIAHNKILEDSRNSMIDFILTVLRANIFEDCFDSLDVEIGDGWIESFAAAYLDSNKNVMLSDTKSIVNRLKNEASKLEEFDEKIGECDIREASNEFFGSDFTELFLGPEEDSDIEDDGETP
ncbi:hypothetical protein SAMN06265338_12514 [Rhodoblastus acidophilus]|uniref:Uncharacterized protein n=1 Tax=Rhodoblastus acidophilus TaxID=1074 RepID=A0A212SCK6_RHOAC|nr:hypothetical protein [Rhodoblastus acidophilus]PPQ35340.1 hypothetical protein CKO16_20775 [Rhodoblastus acidophilus]RAI16964.1 hypothetical protein CH337_18665 [Rhodoblastus acidophilus]SNB83272.1 hypothetical protein SAMN06265338_12514 [Rhodoblastus acidophilus]